MGIHTGHLKQGNMVLNQMKYRFVPINVNYPHFFKDFRQNPCFTDFDIDDPGGFFFQILIFCLNMTRFKSFEGGNMSLPCCGKLWVPIQTDFVPIQYKLTNTDWICANADWPCANTDWFCANADGLCATVWGQSFDKKQCLLVVIDQK